MGYRDTSGKWVDPVFAKLKPGEPFVVLRGQDILAAATLVRWCQLARENGVPEAKVLDMEKNIAEMRKWEPRKIPD